MSDSPMTCEAVERNLEAHLAGSLVPAEENRLANHLMKCPACAAELGLAERVELELAALPSFDAPPELVARIKRSARRQPAPVVELAPRRRRRLVRPAALAAALLAALAIGWWQVGRSERPSQAEVAAAEREARYALALVARIGRKASTEVRDEVLIERVAAPVLRSIGRPFNRRPAQTGGSKS